MSAILLVMIRLIPLVLVWGMITMSKCSPIYLY